IRFLDSRARILILSRRSIRELFMTYLEILWSDSRRSEQRLLQNDPFRETEELSNSKREASVALPFSYTDLAGFLIADRSALMREIKNMKEEGLISEDGQRLRLHWKES
ncbi:MAG: winged helix-turn-helix domain-containing protein, partial [Lachnospiraceae bacterium]|nr:winged helix-turn-helix domain-containing protein [Lachnospiraceae bacterium]